MSLSNNNSSRTKLGIRGRLLMGFGSILIILLAAISIVLVKITIADSHAKQTITNELPSYDAFLNINGQIYHTQASLDNWLLTHDPKYKQDFALAWMNIKHVMGVLDGFSKAWPESYLNSWMMAKSLISDLEQTETNIFNLNFTASSASAAVSHVLTPIINKTLDILDGTMNVTTGDREGGLYDRQYARLEEGTTVVMEAMSDIRRIEYILLIVGTLLAISIAVYTSRSILYPLHNAIHVAKEIAAGKRDVDIQITSRDETGELLTALGSMQDAIKYNEDKLKQNEVKTRELFDNIVKTAKTFSEHSSKVAAGDLTQRINVLDTDEMGVLGKDLNTMTQSLSSIAKQITESSFNMVSMLEEVKHSVDIQSSGATEQASSINQITASLGEIEKSSNQTIDKAKMLGEVAERTREKGQLGLEAVEQSVAGMKAVREKVQTIAQTILDLSNQTQQVGEITAVVNTLAQQSKMLALNASIEAAKAGESGKGFAVVAAEVKNLAEQSEQSTRQVQKILEDIRQATEKAVIATEEGTKGVDHGTGLVEQTGEIVRSLSEVIHETAIASQQIEAAIRQEGIGIEQITAGMNEINHVTSSFVESVKQTNEAINHLAEISDNLKDHVDAYKV